MGRFLSIFEEGLARRAYPRTHRQAESEIRDLDRASGYRKVRRDLSRNDRLPEAALNWAVKQSCSTAASTIALKHSRETLTIREYPRFTLGKQ
ncbi:MAG: hypothetical protein JO106_03365 [Mycobacterium sp.]|nr:hypothetical protein [Mycobacterium sp.]